MINASSIIKEFEKDLGNTPELLDGYIAFSSEDNENENINVDKAYDILSDFENNMKTLSEYYIKLAFMYGYQKGKGAD